MSDSGDRAITTLKAWVSVLGLQKGILRAIDHETSVEIDIQLLLDKPVYLKYMSNSNTNSSTAYMKLYNGGNTGVIFQPKFKNDDDKFYQFGDLPLALFII